jgi:branched-chain amino acid transport system ATP-binding protein
VLLVEHHMPLVMSVSDQLLVLDYGSVLAEGAPADIQADPSGDRRLSRWSGAICRLMPLSAPAAPAPRARKSLLESHGLNSYYGPVQRHSQCQSQRFPGELVALVGGNGAGKTTLLHTLSGLHPPSAGSIDFDGQDMTRWPRIASSPLASVRCLKVVRCSPRSASKIT